MKTRFLVLLWIGLTSNSWGDAPVTVTDLALEGRIDKENVTFSLTFTVDVDKRGARLPLVAGDVAFVEGCFPRRSELKRDGDRLLIEFGRTGEQQVRFDFASLPVGDGAWRSTAFSIPSATVRKLVMDCDRADLQLAFPGALRVDEQVQAEGGKRVTAYLGIAEVFEVRWKPEVRHLDAELVVACDANTIATAAVGALRLDTIYTFRIVQGRLKELVFDVPADVQVIQVLGPHILEWRLETPSGAPRQLWVTLNRPQETRYAIQVESERTLPAFPSQFPLPVLAPREVLRTSGFLLTGTDSAIRLRVEKARGLTQIDFDAYPEACLSPDHPRPRPQRNAFTYQYANLPFTLDLSADDIVTTLHAEDQLVLGLNYRDLILDGALELDVRDAPTREVVLETDLGWTVAQVVGQAVADYDVRDEDGVRLVSVYFREALLGRTLVRLRLERGLAESEKAFSAPGVRVRGAVSERGSLILSAQTGVHLKPDDLQGLREVQPGSLPVRVARAQRAFRFKTADWGLSLRVETTTPAIYAESFHLVSVGEGAVYGSCSVTYHIEGAPIHELRVQVPETYQQVDFVGRDIRSWTREGTERIITLQESVLGDYTLLVAYEQPLAEANEEIAVGGIVTLGTDSEVGYIAVSGAPSLGVDEVGEPATGMIPIERAEIPPAYRLLINESVLRAYKFVQGPHTATLNVRPYPTQSRLTQVADHTAIETRVSEEGELVTTVQYFVKNTSDQYLRVALPSQAQLWSARVDGEDVQALDTEEKGQMLIPLQRYLDPNRPLSVELVYAQAAGALGWRKALRLEAPVSAAQSVFARWTVAVPDRFALANRGGSMFGEDVTTMTGLWSLLQRLGQATMNVVRRGPSWLGVLIAAFMAVGLAGYTSGLGKGRGWALPAGLLLVMGAVWVVSAAGDMDALGRCLFGPVEAVTPVQTQSYTRVVSLAESELMLDLSVVPAWIGGSGSPLWCGVGLVAGMGLLWRGWKNPWRIALGLAFACWGLSQLVISLQATYVLALVGVPLWICTLLARESHRLGRQAAEKALLREDPPPLVHPDMGLEPNGFVSVSALVGMAVLTCGLSVAVPGVPIACERPPEPPPVITLSDVELEINAPGTGPDAERIARVHLRMCIQAEEAGTLHVLSASHVAADVRIPSDRLRLVQNESGYLLEVDRRGEYEMELDVLAPITEDGGTWGMQLDLPVALKNRARLRLPETELEIRSPDAVWLKTSPAGDGTETELIFRPVPVVRLNWRPQVRRTTLEEAVVFSEVDLLATFDAGVVHVANRVGYQIAKGELSALGLRIPEGLSVTAVKGDHVGTWRFDPVTRNLDVLLDQPVSGEYDLHVSTQVAEEGLPYQVVLEIPEVLDASRQRGAIAVAAPETVQIRVDQADGMHPMNAGDFTRETGLPGAMGHRMGRPAEVKRSFRYHRLPATATVHAVAVLPELRVVEQGKLDISDERIVLSSRLDITISKSGLFTVDMRIPPGYEVESLSGEDVSHWDEAVDSASRVAIHFTRQVLGTRALQLVLARTGAGIEETIQVPRIEVLTAVKHNGTMVVSGEQGVRFRTVQRDGVSEVNPRELGIAGTGFLAFRLLRPDWSVALATDVLEAVVKAEVLQRIDIREGLMQGTCWIRYGLDHAGIKSFRLQAPAPGVALHVLGNDIARVRELDAERGIWHVDLRRKVDQAYALEVRYQQPYTDRAGIHLVRTLGAQAQSGYLAVCSGGRLQVRAERVSAGLNEENARALPGNFGAGDLSNAILCYRYSRSDVSLDLSVVRHDTVDVLPASVTRVRLDSVVSGDEQMVTRVTLDLMVGDLRFLEAELPPGSHLWAVFVQDKAVTPLVEGRRTLIPLEQTGTREHVVVELTYGGRGAVEGARREQVFAGPRFNLPLRDVEWVFYLPPQYRYYDFGGTLRRPPNTSLSRVLRFDARRYESLAKQQVTENLKRAEQALKKGERYAREGRQLEARKAFEAAMDGSQGAGAFNEDARIQYRNLARRQAVVGLVNRRDELKQSRNLRDEDQMSKLRGFQNGNWTLAYGQEIEASLDADDTDSLNQVAERILDQQTAAAGQVPAIRVNLPLHGREVPLIRALQINPSADMHVTFRKRPASGTSFIRSLAAFAVLVVIGRFSLAPPRARSRLFREA